MQSLRRRQLNWLAGFLLASYAAAGLGSLFTLPALEGWYRHLRKPGWTPPDRVFGPVWTVLYTQIALSAWLARRAARNEQSSRPALFAWCAQLALSLAWSGAFFGRRSPAAGLFVIGALWIAIVATLALAARLSRASAALLVPYLAWTSFAAALNWRIWRINR